MLTTLGTHQQVTIYMRNFGLVALRKWVQQGKRKNQCPSAGMAGKAPFRLNLNGAALLTQDALTVMKGLAGRNPSGNLYL
ncbi:MAG TPA: hypothetical protein DCZ93_01825 [Elusimicrobia bacterium]|nr:hypothetical protein [Elusimicrobiota bacterium]